MEKLILIKLGGSLITDKSRPFMAKEAIIKRFGREIKKAAKKFGGKIIIGHGSGSFGHTVAAKYQTQKGLINKNSIEGLALVADAAIAINRIVIKNFLSESLPVVSLSPVSFIASNNQSATSLLVQPIEQALKAGVIPVIYGDIIFDSAQAFCIFSAEKTLDILARNLAKKFKIIKVIQVSDVDGVYDKEGNVIPKITPKNFNNFVEAIGASGKTDVTGGMRHKVEEGLSLAKSYGIKTEIIGGKKRGLIYDTILGKKIEGTLISRN